MQCLLADSMNKKVLNSHFGQYCDTIPTEKTFDSNLFYLCRSFINLSITQITRRLSKVAFLYIQ